MKTRKVINMPGHGHELTFSCYHRLPLLNRDRTRQWFVQALDQSRRKHEIDVIAYVIMPEHAHVLVIPQRLEYHIEDFQKSLKQSVSRRAIDWLRHNAPNYLPQLAGEQTKKRIRYHFWQPGGGYDRNVTKSDTVRKMVDYIHANPLRRQLAKRPIDWLWSSARFYAGLDDVKIEMDRRLF